MSLESLHPLHTLSSPDVSISQLYCCSGVLSVVCEAGVTVCSVHCPPGGIANALGRREVRGVASDSLLVIPKWLLPKQVSHVRWGGERGAWSIWCKLSIHTRLSESELIYHA